MKELKYLIILIYLRSTFYTINDLLFLIPSSRRCADAVPAYRDPGVENDLEHPVRCVPDPRLTYLNY